MKKYYVTDKEVEVARKMLREKGIGWSNGQFNPPETKQDKELYAELNAIGMIHSFVAYHNWETRNTWVSDYYFRDHLQALGEEKLKKLIDVTISRVERVKRNVHTDSEGLTYNSIIWKEDINE